MSKVINILEPHEVDQVLAYLKKPFYGGSLNPNYRRDELLFVLMLDTGIRVGELVKLLVTDLFINCDCVTSLVVRSEVAKNKRERVIPISTRLRMAVRNFSTNLSMIPPLRPTEFLFAKYTGSKPISTRQVQRIVLFACNKCLGRPVTPHMLRHTFATRLMRQTNIRVVQELLGHRRLSSTQIYTHPNSEDLRKAINSI